MSKEMELPTDHEKDLVKDSLEIRQNLVDTAAQFLNMNNILTQPESMKRKFLEKKGLTMQEIELAVQQSKSQQFANALSVVPASNYVPQNQLALVPPLPITPYIPPSTLWTKLRSFANIIIFLSGVTFGFKYLYKYYIGPFLTGQTPKSKEDSLLEVQVSIIKVLTQIETTLERINRNILDQNVKKSEESRAIRNESYSIEELKTELNTIKSLLINKKSFPASPALCPSIPQWQKRSLPELEAFPESQNKDELGTTSKAEAVLTNGKGPDEHKDTVDLIMENAEGPTVAVEKNNN